MGINRIVAKQYRDKVNQAYHELGSLSLPPEGWLRTVRHAFGMSGSQLAKRLGVTKARVSKAEQGELTGSVTIKTMQSMAEAMNCRFVYAVVPDQEIEEMIKRRAFQKAGEQVKNASTHMALEAQTLSDDQLSFEIDRIASEMVEKMPSDLWNDT
ncbi:MAG: mobile mystery protein A [Halioglobus sp.]